jgi:hypothetical protein
MPAYNGPGPCEATMFEIIGGVFRSFYSTHHYDYVANDKDGLELVTAYVLSLLTFIGLFCWAAYYVGFSGIDQILRAQIRNEELVLAPAFDLLTNTYVFLALMGMACAFGLMFTLLNMAVIYAGFSQILNHLLEADLTYCQLVRMSMHAQIPATVIGIALFNLVRLGYPIPLVPWLFVCLAIAFTIYMAYAISSVSPTPVQPSLY